MVTPGGDVIYDIPVMKSQRYTIKEIFEKNLLFLIPFYIFSHEKRFGEYEKDETKLDTLKREYEQIKNSLEEMMNQGKISEYIRCTIIDMSNKVLEHIAAKYDSVKGGVKSVMGGKVLEYEAKTIRNEGIKKGREMGWEEGRILTVRIFRTAKRNPEYTIEQIAEEAGCSVWEVEDTLHMLGV